MAEGYINIGAEDSDSNDESLLRNSMEAASNWMCDRDHENKGLLDFSHLNLDGMTLHHNLEAFKKPEEDTEEPEPVDKKPGAHSLHLQNNRLDFLPQNIQKFLHLKHLNLSDNYLTEINEVIFELKELTSLVARNNFLGDLSLPKKLGTLTKLEELNLSGNSFRNFPPEIIDVKSLKSLYLGSNQLEDVPRDIWKLEKLEVLYLGGNQLRDIPAEMGRLLHLRSLVLCENQLQSLPSTISCLRRLRSLSLHKNQLTTLPPEIVTLKGLIELSLRDNPLVVRFVQDMTYDPPSLQELAARSIKLLRVPYTKMDLPANLVHYLKSACRCVNPKCKGVYFDVRVEHIKFVDFCGKYRIPLLQYLCSPTCSGAQSPIDSTSSDSDDSDVPHSRLRRVLLG